MTQMVSLSPFQILNSGDEQLHPNAFLHFLSGEPVTPTPFVFFGQIDERAPRLHERSQFLNTCRRDAGTKPFALGQRKTTSSPRNIR